MEKINICSLRSNRVEILRSLEANDVVGFLFEDKILSFSDCELVHNGKTRKERSRTLLDTLVKRGPTAFDLFLKALNSANYEYLTEILISHVYDTRNRNGASGTSTGKMGLKEKAIHHKSYNKSNPFFCAILKNVEPNDILDFLFQEFVLSENECEEIRQCSSRKRRCLSMFHKLSLKSSNVSAILSEAFRNSKYDFILDIDKSSNGDRSEQEFCQLYCKHSVDNLLTTKSFTKSGHNTLNRSHKKVEKGWDKTNSDSSEGCQSCILKRKRSSTRVPDHLSMLKSVKYSKSMLKIENFSKNKSTALPDTITSSAKTPLENTYGLLVAFNYLSTLINQGKFSAFESCSTRLEIKYKTVFDLQCILFYLRASRELFRINSDHAKKHINAALAITPKTSHPVYFTVELLSATSRMYLNKRKFLKFQNIIDDAKMLIESFPVQCAGHAAGWLYLNEARYIMTQIDCFNFRMSKATSALRCLMTKAERSLIQSIEFFKRDKGKDGPFGQGYALCRMTILLLQCGANGRLMFILRPPKTDIERAGRCVRTLLSIEADLPKMLQMHINLANCDYNYRLNNIDLAVKFANEAKNLGDKMEMLEFSEHANNRLSNLTTKLRKGKIT